MVVNVDLQRPGIVVLADAFERGWRLTIDGRPAPILRANLLMRAASVSAGAHKLIYTYDPPSVRIGAAISLSGLAALAGLAFWAHAIPATAGPPGGQATRSSLIGPVTSRSPGPRGDGAARGRAAWPRSG